VWRKFPRSTISANKIVHREKKTRSKYAVTFCDRDHLRDYAMLVKKEIKVIFRGTENTEKNNVDMSFLLLKHFS
jgi:hypothetical protein